MKNAEKKNGSNFTTLIDEPILVPDSSDWPHRIDTCVASVEGKANKRQNLRACKREKSQLVISYLLLPFTTPTGKKDGEVVNAELGSDERCKYD